MESLKEISTLLNITTRLDLKAVALQNILNITGSKEGRELLVGSVDILRQLIALMRDKSMPVAKDAALSVINISGDETGANVFLSISESADKDKTQKYTYNLIEVCMSCIMDPNSVLADPCCMILSNMTRPKYLLDRVIHLIETSGHPWNYIVTLFSVTNFNTTGANLDYLGPVFSNLSQSRYIRRFITCKTSRIMSNFLAIVKYSDSIVRRRGIIGALKNCCFEVDRHEWLLSDDVDILSYLLLPIAGPEEFSDEDNDKLPINLQHLPKTKERESDPDIRVMVLEALEQLCATKRGREILREKNIYIILRELHKSEKCKEVLLACENVVDILIRTEEEIGVDNIKEVEIPKEYGEKFQIMNEKFINNM